MDNDTVELAALMAEISSIKADVEGMKTENKQREKNGEPLAYTEKHFSDLAYQINIIAQKMRLLKH